MAEKCEHMWPGLFGTHYCGETEAHEVHVCGEPGCSVTDHTNGVVMTDRFSAECGMTGCPYVAEGTSLRQTAARLTTHWTLAKDHDEHIRTVIESAVLDSDHG